MSDDRINSVSIVVTTKDAGVIGEESHRDVRSADDLHRVLTYMAAGCPIQIGRGDYVGYVRGVAGLVIAVVGSIIERDA